MVDGPEVIEELFTEESSYGSNTVVVIVTIFLMGLTTIAAAWSGFQASKWHGEMVNTFMEARAIHDESEIITLEGNQKLLLDIHIFLQWLNAVSSEKTELANFYRERMSDELIPALDAWLATDPRQNPEAPNSPFAMPEYVRGGQEETWSLDEKFRALYDEAIAANHTSEDYILITVVLASGLFFAGIATRLHNRKIEFIVTCFSMAALGYAAYFLISYPVLI